MMIESFIGKITEFPEKLYYVYRRNGWVLDIRRYFKLSTKSDTQIDKPIFLLGTQGGGLTFVSRCLRRNKDVVSVTGNCRYWSGADEMQHVIGGLLPKDLTWRNQTRDDYFGTIGGWVYATDRALARFRRTSDAASEELRFSFRRTLQWLIEKHAAKGSKPRFTDKSQLYTVKMSLLNELLKDCSPRFILITRNPYALCYRAALGGGLRDLKGKFTFEERLVFAAEHWRNSMQCVLDDAVDVEHLHVVQFEKILQQPELEIKKICVFAELDFSNEMIPQEHHNIPYGSQYKDRWFPVRVNVNDGYLEEISESSIEIIEEHCGTIAGQFGYTKPTAKIRPSLSHARS